MSNLKDPAAFLDEHYVYEINMLMLTYFGIPIEHDDWKRNALMESFAVHARVLLDFFLTPPKGDDVVADHFMPPSVQFAATHMQQLPPNLRTRINKQVPHLTETRESTVKIGPSDRDDLYRALMADHADFKLKVDPKYQGCFGKEVTVTMQTGAAGPSATNQISSA